MAPMAIGSRRGPCCGTWPEAQCEAAQIASEEAEPLRRRIAGHVKVLVNEGTEMQRQVAASCRKAA